MGTEIEWGRAGRRGCDGSPCPTFFDFRRGGERDFGRRLSSLLLRESDKKAQTHEMSLGVFNVNLHVQADFFADFTFAQRARCAAAILLRALADIVRFLGIVTTFAFSPFVFTFAQRALWAAAILALPAADIPPRGAVPFPYAAPKAESAALIAFISLVNRSCSFFNVCTTLTRFVIESPSRGL